MGFGTISRGRSRPSSAGTPGVTHRIAHRDFEAVRATAERDGTETHALLVAQDQRAALRVLFHYAQTTFEEVPALKRDLTTSLTSSLTLKNGVVLSAYRCRPTAVRGVLPPSAPMPSRSPASIEP